MKKIISLLSLCTMLVANCFSVYAADGYDTNVYYWANGSVQENFALAQQFDTIQDAFSVLGEVKVPVTIVNETDMNFTAFMLVSYEPISEGVDWPTMLGPVKYTCFDNEEGCAVDGETITIAPGQSSANVAGDASLPMVFISGDDYITICIDTEKGQLSWEDLMGQDYFYELSPKGITLIFRGTFDNCILSIN